MIDDFPQGGVVTVDPSATETLEAILGSTPPERRFAEGLPNTYRFPACEIEASLSEDSPEGVWTVHSVTVY